MTKATKAGFEAAAQELEAMLAADLWTYRIRQVEGAYGLPQPQLEVEGHGISPRELSAHLFRLAAQVELRSEAHQHSVRVEVDYTSAKKHGGRGKGRVVLELAEGTEAEAKVGLKVLGEALTAIGGRV